MLEADAFLLALGVVVKLVLVVGVGGYAAARPRGRPLLAKATIQDLSRLSAAALIPCLIVASIGSSVSVKLLKSSAVVAAFGLVTVVTGAAAMELWGRCFVPAHQRASSLWGVASLAAAFPNIVAVPLVAVASLCERREVREDYDNVLDCASSGSAIIFVNSFAWSVLFFTAGVARLRALAPSKERMERGPLLAVAAFLLEPLNLALAIGTFIGLIGPLRRCLFKAPRSPLRVLGSTIELLASPVVCFAILLTGASLANLDLDALAANVSRDAVELADIKPDGAEAKGTDLADVEPDEGADAAPAKRASVRGAARSVRTIIVGFCLVRLVIVPVAIFALEACAFSALPLPRDKLGRAVILISSGMPSAQILVILLHKFGLSQQAAELSFLFVFQYSASILTMTVVISAVLARVY